MRWEGPGSGFESSSGAGGAAAGVWNFQNLEIWESWSFAPFGIGLKKQGFRTAWDRTGQNNQEFGLQLKAFVLIVRDLDRHLSQKIIRVAGWDI